MPNDPALEALAAGLGPARALGLDIDAAEAVLRHARVPGGNGTAAAGHATAARTALTNLAQAAGLRTVGVRDLIPDPAQRRGIDGAIAEVALVLDMDGFEEQALALVRNGARAEGLGPVRWIEALRQRRSKRPPSPADPEAHLRAWKARGVLTRAADQVRRAIEESLPEIPEGLRAVYTAAGEGDLEDRFQDGVDRLISNRAPEAATPPYNRSWRVVGVLQWLNVVLFGIAIVSLVGGMTGALPVWTIHLPFFRGVPAAPLMLLLCPLLLFALTLGLHLNAEKMGRAWSSRIENEIRRGVREVVEAEAFAPLAPVESARARLGEAWHLILRGG